MKKRLSVLMACLIGFGQLLSAESRDDCIEISNHDLLECIQCADELKGVHESDPVDYACDVDGSRVTIYTKQHTIKTTRSMSIPNLESCEIVDGKAEFFYRDGVGFWASLGTHSAAFFAGLVSGLLLR